MATLTSIRKGMKILKLHSTQTVPGGLEVKADSTLLDANVKSVITRGFQN